MYEFFCRLVTVEDCGRVDIFDDCAILSVASTDASLVTSQSHYIVNRDARVIVRSYEDSSVVSFTDVDRVNVMFTCDTKDAMTMVNLLKIGGYNVDFM